MKLPFFSLSLRTLLRAGFLLVLPVSMNFAQSPHGSPPADSEYAKVADGRADKIVATLRLDDPAKAKQVRELISEQYQHLNTAQAPLDEAKKAVKTAAPEKKDQAKTALVQAQAETASAVQALHDKYLAALNAVLTPEQVDKVKDGMTYGVLPLTFRVYQAMRPNLTAEQKAQILAWLTEAREHAIDGGSSEEKHAWFGKYKGRINNYLAKAGIDMKQAEKEMTARLKHNDDAHP
jgi:Spy/CpxP family protein refolding chaperone